MALKPPAGQTGGAGVPNLPQGFAPSSPPVQHLKPVPERCHGQGQCESCSSATGAGTACPRQRGRCGGCAAPAGGGLRSAGPGSDCFPRSPCAAARCRPVEGGHSIILAAFGRGAFRPRSRLPSIRAGEERGCRGSPNPVGCRSRVGAGSSFALPGAVGLKRGLFALL